MNIKRILIIGAGVSGVLGMLGVSVWIWSIGSPVRIADQKIYLDIISGVVEVKQGDVWSTARDGQDIQQGDILKTTADAEALIIWGGLGMTRIDPSTELVIDQASLGSSEKSGSLIAIKLQSGRIWNRMLKLLDIDSSMEVKTSDIVATVRGTTYGIAKQLACTEATVAESAVGLSDGVQDEVVLTDNQRGVFGATDCAKSIQAVTSDDQEYQDEKSKDQAFDVETAIRFRESADAHKRNAPGWAQNISERLRMAVADNEAKQDLAWDYAKQKLSLMIENPGQAQQYMQEIRQLIPMLGKNTASFGREMNELVTLLTRMRLLGMGNQMSQVLPRSLATDSTLDELRLLRDLTSEQTDVDRLYRELLQIDEDVDDIVQGIVSRQERATAEEKIRARLDLIDRRIADKGDDRYAKKSKAIRARLLNAGEAPVIEPIITIDVQDKTEVIVNEPTLQNPIIKAPTKPTTPPTISPTALPTTLPTPIELAPNQPTRIYESLSILPSPLAPKDGQSVTLKMFGKKSDGTSDELTSQTLFSLARASDGVIQGNILTPKYVGNITVIATFSDAQGSRTVSVTIVHSATQMTNALQAIEIRFIGPTTVTCSTSIPYKIYAIYGNQSSSDVTISSKISVSDTKLLYPGDQKILTFCSGVQASGAMTATYTEDGITKSAQATITVVPDAPTPSAPSNRFQYQYLY